MNGGIASPSGDQGSGGSARGQRAVDAGEGVGSPEDGQRVEQADSLCASGRGDAQRVDDLGDLDSLRFDEPMNECIEGRCVNATADAGMAMSDGGTSPGEDAGSAGDQPEVEE